LTYLFTIPGPALSGDWLAAAGAPLGKQLPEASGAVWLFLPENKAEYESRLFIAIFKGIVRCVSFLKFVCWLFVAQISLALQSLQRIAALCCRRKKYKLLHCCPHSTLPQCFVLFLVS
jgi:hypothetical protein